MKKNPEDLQVGDVKILDSTPPEEVETKPTSVMTLEAEIENTEKQPLRKLRDFYTATKQIPSNLRPEAQMVLHFLLSCFEKQKSVEEGLVQDIVFGFENAQVPIPPALTIEGLRSLGKEGYVYFQAPDNTRIDASSDKLDEAWVRYTKKILDLVYED